MSIRLSCWPLLLAALAVLPCTMPAAAPPTNNPVMSRLQPATPSRVVVAHDPDATDAFKPRLDTIRHMARLGLNKLVGKPSVNECWATMLRTNDVVGIKVHSGPGADTGTRPAVVAAIIEQLIAFGIPAGRIIVWDRQKADLRRAGFADLSATYGVRLEGAVNSGFNPEAFYQPEQPVLGQLLWSDLEFGKKGTDVGRRSFVSKLLGEMTRIIVITPLLNHNTAGVHGNLYSLAMGSLDNVLRFENDMLRLKNAVPEIYALPYLSDRVVLCITDALVCQYEGEQQGLLHYSIPLNELRFSTDPVALDILSLRELERQRSTSTKPVPRRGSLAEQKELLDNAALLDLGTSEVDNIRIEHVP